MRSKELQPGEHPLANRAWKRNQPSLNSTISTMACLGTLLLHSAAAHGQGPPTRPSLPEGVTAVPYVYGGTLYDTNLFRTSDDEEARARVGTDDTSEWVNRFGAGVKARLPVSLQTLRFDGWLQRVTYDNFDELDHNAANANAAWDWQLGQLWSGTLSGGYRRGIASFEEFQAVTKDIKTSRDVALDAEFRFLPDWAVAGGTKWRRADHRERDFLDRTDTTHFVEARYYSLTRTRVGLRASRTEGDFDEQQTFAGGETLSNDYTKTSYSLVLGWEGTSKSYLQARFGYTLRDHEDRDERDFRGFTSQADYTWKASPKTTVQFALWRDLRTLDDEISSFVEARGVRVEPRWKATPLLTVRGGLTYENRQFSGARGTDTADEEREDTLRSARVGLDYELLRSLRLSLEGVVKERDSNLENREYRYEQVIGGAAYAF